MKTTFAATALIAFVSAAGEYYDDHADHSDYDNGYTGPIAPESFGYAVNDFDINEPTIGNTVTAVHKSNHKQFERIDVQVCLGEL